MTEAPLFDGINIIKGYFTNKYEDGHIIPCLNSFQNLHNRVHSGMEIERVGIINVTGSKQDIANWIGDPQFIPTNHKSIFAVNVGDHWASMVIHNLPEGMRVQYNDSARLQMPPVLREALRDLGIDDLIDYKSAMGPGGNNCGRNIFVNLYQMVENPYADRLFAPGIQDPEHNKICRITHVLFSSDYFLRIKDKVEATTLLDIFSKLHAQVTQGQLEGNFKTLCSYLAQKDSKLLNDCQGAISQVRFRDASGQADEICLSQLEKLAKASQITTHHEDLGGGTEEVKEGEHKPILQKHNLGNDYEMNVCQGGKTFLTLKGEKCKLIREKTTEGMKGEIYENPANHEEIGVLWVSGEPSLSEVEALGYILVGHDITA